MDTITVNNLLDINNETIYRLFLEANKNLISDYSYVNLSEKVFKQLVLEAIRKSKMEYMGDIPYGKYLLKLVRININNVVKKQMLNSQTRLDVINNYIEQKANITSSVGFISKLSKFLETYHLSLEPDLVVSLLANQAFSNIVKDIYKSYESVIKNKTIFDISDSNIKLILEVYCDLNNISIYDSENNYLSREEQISLVLKAQQGDNLATSILLESNYGLISKIAKRYAGLGLDFEDLMQEGRIGMLTAIKKFDKTKKCAFSTYAVWWIRQGIARALADQGRTIRLPVHVFEKESKIKKAISKYNEVFGREPTEEELATYLKMPLETVKEISRALIKPVSINVHISEEDDNELGDFIADPAGTPEDNFLETDLGSELEKIFASSTLTEKEVEVLKYRYGFIDNKIYTLEEIGNMYNVTKERIRQIEHKALMKLRRKREMRSLRGYVDEMSDVNLTTHQTYQKKTLYQRISLYEEYKEYSVKEINYVLDKLEQFDIYILLKRYGKKLDGYSEYTLTNEETLYFFKTLKIKIRKMLEKREGLNLPNYKLITNLEYYYNQIDLKKRKR